MIRIGESRKGESAGTSSSSGEWLTAKAKGGGEKGREPLDMEKKDIDHRGCVAFYSGKKRV